MPHLHQQIVVLLEALLARLDCNLDELLELGALDGVEDVHHPFAVEAVSVALVEQVPEGDLRRPCQLDHVLDGEALDLLHLGHQDLVPADVLQCLGKL